MLKGTKLAFVIHKNSPHIIHMFLWRLHLKVETNFLKIKIGVGLLTITFSII